MKRILVLCTGNSCRSQIAEGYLRQLSNGTLAVFSAGTAPHGVHPYAIATMREDGVDISGHTSDAADAYRDTAFDYVLTVCDHAQEHCPVFPGAAIRYHHSFPDPAKARGTEAEILQHFREVRRQIKAYCRTLLLEIGHTHDTAATH